MKSMQVELPPAWRVTILLLLSLAAQACKHEPPRQLPPPTVKVAAVAKSDSSRELRLSGTLEAERSIALSFAVIGTVEQVFVQEGEAVARGQALARISPQSYANAVGMAKATADRAEDAYRRLEPMHRNQTLADVKMVEVETGLQQARLALSIAQKSLDDAVLRAPRAGIVARRNIEPGMSATPVLPAFVLVETKTLLATAPAPEMQVAKLKRGMSARVTVPAIQKTLDGNVREIAVIANPLTRTYDVKVALPNPTGEIRVGMIAEVHLQVDEGNSNPVVPPEAVRVDETGAPFVFVVAQEKKLQRRHVEVAGFVGEGTALSKGVREGELVVTSGTPMLSDGMTVRLAGQEISGARQ